MCYALNMKNSKLLSNFIYALKQCYSISKKRVIGTVILAAIMHFMSVFINVFFSRRLIQFAFDGKPVTEIYAYIAIGVLIFFVLGNIGTYIIEVVKPLCDIKIYEGIYRKIYDKAKNVELRCYEDTDFYNSYTKAMEDADKNIIELVEYVTGAVMGLIAAAVIFWQMFEIAPLSILFVAFPMIGNFLFGNLKNRLEFKLYQDNVSNSKVYNYVNRVMYLKDYAKEIRLSNVFHLLRKQYEDAVEKNRGLVRRYSVKMSAANFFQWLFTFSIVFEGLLLYAAYENLVTHNISFADLSIMTIIMNSVVWSLIGIFENIVEGTKRALFVDNLRTFLEYEEKLPEDQEGLIPSAAFESLEFENVCFAYGEKENIHKLSFKINAGEKIALVGHNGAGKSTIIKLMLRLYDPAEGHIYYNGIDIRKYNLRLYRQLFATAFQDVEMFGMSVRDNVLLGKNYDNADERIVCALKKAGIYEKIEKLPGGLNAQMTREFDEDGIVLSGGENQKLSVARAFLSDAPIKVYDEPSSALDPVAEYELFKSLMADSEGHTLVLISHRLSSVKNVDRIFVFEKGRLIESGPHKQLMKDEKRYAKMYRMQARNYLAKEDLDGVLL